MKQICIVGAGQLGSRHLQALKKLNIDCCIYVVDPDHKALKRARCIYDETKGSNTYKRILYRSSLKYIREETDHFDIVIVASNSLHRKTIITETVNIFTVDCFILEKVLFQKLEDYTIVQDIFDREGIRAWVNCPRRYFKIYKDIKTDLEKSSSFEISVSGTNWGMGCNSIHFIDLIAFLSGSTDLKINIDDLDEGIIESKRKGFFEMTGSLSGQCGKCKSFRLTSYKEGNIKTSISIIGDISKYIILEGEGISYILSENDNSFGVNKIKIPFQSELTNIVVEDICFNDNCSLTTYEESKILHIELEKELIPFFKRFGIGGEICPIT